MDLNEIKINGTNMLNVTDSLKAPLLKINIKNNENTIIPEGTDLVIYIDQESTPTDNRKTYSFTLSESLKFLNGISDEFIVEPIFDDKKVKLKTYIKRYIQDGLVAETPLIEELGTQAITLFEGVNYIYSNYTNCTIDICYPKNSDLMKYFLNIAIYGLNNNDKILSLDDIYFKDCFTQIEDGINASFNKATIKCLSSINSSFSLDCEGNLVVNSITTRENSSTAPDFSTIYPVGSVYLSVNNVNPTTLFGGTWEQISGYYLYAGTSNSTGGSDTTGAASGNTGSTTLSASQIPSHRHSIPALSGTAASNGNHAHNIGADLDAGSTGSLRYSVHSKGVTGAAYQMPSSTTGAHTHSVSTSASNTGYIGGTSGHTHTLNSHTHTINPPYYSLYAFKRTA